ncbi:NAD(P) transhydrogenase subunit alpha [Anaerolineales bacterium HSG25]|nr:NAD(P) transhydrogenase subunit alpha [Anaerolineales bacterium HSG25]
MKHIKQITYTVLATGLFFVAMTTPVLAAEEASSSGESLTPVYLAFILALSIFLGFELISKVPATLHTPLMSGSNAISGVTLVGALIAAGHGGEMMATILGTLAVAFATINVVGGYMVTDRMLEMFKKKGD